MLSLDSVHIAFDEDSLWLLNICLAIIMFGVALDIRLADFKALFKSPKPIIVGLSSQLILLPVLTLILIYIAEPLPSLALGMMLVAACPGGNISNFMSSMAKGNIALSVSLTACTTISAIIFTPLIFTLLGTSYAPTKELLKTFSVSISEVAFTVTFILGIPLISGIMFNHYLLKWTKKLRVVIKPLSIAIFVAFVGVAFYKNKEIFLNYFQYIVYLVFAHNAIAFLGAYLYSGLFQLSLYDRRSITIETGIQNSGLGLILIFSFFDGLGGMAMIAAWWGIWHILSGLTLATFWSYKPVSLTT
ncbi:bile acid:sodium symporter family protein [Fulvivirga lutea]|uniref:Bile acid:sodium symporter family protein n=1 Tax=Fulvivirga lutea TaxID=2810512 RepID=A0A975A2I3_9BACT|nr:bile acid:sodium symporter family protein [Fulvivirga lutea]QSE99325.1 bile acid:sodium symporter family protein [Fulvivirga lutea]